MEEQDEQEPGISFSCFFQKSEAERNLECKHTSPPNFPLGCGLRCCISTTPIPLALSLREKPRGNPNQHQPGFKELP